MVILSDHIFFIYDHMGVGERPSLKSFSMLVSKSDG
jgi:hypothetical protein